MGNDDLVELGRQTSIAGDDVWVVNSTLVECARSRETVKRSDLAGWALTGTKADEREVLEAIVELLRKARKGEKPRPGQEFFKPLRQIIESDNATFKTQLDIDPHRGKTIAGVCTRIAQRVLALATAFWHNDNLGLTVRRSLTAYDH